MSALPRVLGALALAVVMLVPGQAAAAAPTQDPTPVSSSTTAPAQDAPVLFTSRSGTLTAPDFATQGWVLADMDTGQILASRGADQAVRPASTLKLLTALTVAPRLSPEQPYRAVAADETAEGNRVVLYRGLTYTVADLLHAALLPSANDAAEALARANGGITTTVEQMNAEAARLGATHTTVKNPSGLDADGQFTTALDMAVIGRAAISNSEIASYLMLRTVDFPGKMSGGSRVIYPIYNHNRLLMDHFEGTLGGKSGYTTLARRTFVAAAERDGHRLLVSLMNIGGNTYTTGEQLLDWGFANYNDLEPVGTLPEPSAPAPVFDRTVVPLTDAATSPTTREALPEGSAADAPTATTGTSGWGLIPRPGLPSLPSPLTLLTMAMAVLVALRARVYWINHRHRTAWVELDTWARAQARSARRPGPADARTRATRATRAQSTSRSRNLVDTPR